MNTIHIASGPNAEDITVPQLFAGDSPAVATRDVKFVAAQGAIAQYVPLTLDPATGNYVAWSVDDPALPISAVTAYAVPDQAVDQRCAVYTSGCFNIDAIAWPASTTEEDVDAALAVAGANHTLVFRKLLYSDKREAAGGLDVGPGNQPPPEA